MPEDGATVNRHYGRPDMATSILAALQAAGKDTANLTRDDLASFDELHMLGRAGTRELARLAGLPKGARVLDVGCGVGGPARTLAAEFGLRVEGVDLTEEFVEAAEALTRATHIEPPPAFRVADATRLPFPDGTLDGVFLLHVTMNIRDKPGLLREVHRVLRGGGVLVLLEVCAGPTPGGPHYPAVWAERPQDSFLETAEGFRAAVRAAGFVEESWEDVSPQGIAWYERVAKRWSAPADPTVVGRELALGPKWPERGANTKRSLEEGRLAVVRGRFVKR